MSDLPLESSINAVLPRDFDDTERHLRLPVLGMTYRALLPNTRCRRFYRHILMRMPGTEQSMSRLADCSHAELRYLVIIELVSAVQSSRKE